MDGLEPADDARPTEFIDEWIALHRAFRYENAVWLNRVYADASQARQALAGTESWLADGQ